MIYLLICTFPIAIRQSAQLRYRLILLLKVDDQPIPQQLIATINFRLYCLHCAELRLEMCKLSMI